MEQKNPRKPSHPEDEEKHKSAYDLLERQRAERAAKEAAAAAHAEEKHSKAYELLERQRAERAGKEAADQTKAAPAASPVPPITPQAFIAEHTVVSGDTLSGIALKYYGSAAREKWMAIYEANKEIIGSNPGLIRVGQVFNIPDLD